MAGLVGSVVLLPLLFNPPAQYAVPEGPLAADVVDGLEAAEPAADPAAAPAVDPAAPAAPLGEGAAPTPPARDKKEWMLVIAPGGDYIKAKNWKAVGGGFRLGGHAIKWGGSNHGFLVGGGPVLHYTYLKDPDFNDAIHLATVNGELILGGGNRGKFGVYGHVLLGLGFLRAVDGSGLTISTLGARGAAGLGGFGKINKRFSLGALVDFGWAGGLWINGMLTANIHFGRDGHEPAGR